MRPTTEFKVVDDELVRLDTWHPIDGEWVHLVQVVDEKGVKYYTGGLLSGTADRGGPTEIVEQPKEMPMP